jgi:hypothetical protein
MLTAVQNVMQRRLAQIHVLADLTATNSDDLISAALGGFIESQKALLPDQVVAAVEKAGKEHA